ncbi:MAG TPA: thiamine ABC transporter substrate-binding protein [Segeticoccus sp.]|uniref:thiamine ABC transporter substrate-binding protein n=1 Tax=Segeticoccus sp. TaxID=2706531 RepID=UPI002D8087C0|nr:thiamine ABC transporter substrate-binding protein [Segeticoccus sp.]HET8600801.1 thiamine ABC transporter substrate-binding protein [Segeticoccus sp.]
MPSPAATLQEPRDGSATTHRSLRRSLRLAGAVALTCGLAACSMSSGGTAASSSAPSGSAGATGAAGAKPGHGQTITLVTHDSFVAPKKTLQEFTKETGYRVQVSTQGDAGELTNKLVLTKNSPIGDAMFGVDNTFASRAVDAGVFAPHQVPNPPKGLQRFQLPDPRDRKVLTPVDYGDVCVNVDNQWFARHHQAPPKNLDDLLKPAYKNLFVTPGASTSSPGMAFLLTTIAKYGQPGWQDYWRKLMANGAKVTSGWTDAYEVDFSGGGGHGARPIVLSYASSPPYTIPKGGSKPTTSALLDTCFRQVEFAGVLKGAQHPQGAALLVNFLVSKTFQRTVPENMYVYPVNTSVALPADWAKWAKVAPHPFSVSPRSIAQHRTEWLRQWAEIATS